ncbi:MAG TPA: acyl-CoA thioesterase [Bacteroidales bacterium]|nr:acyl-CoA thioesterase [Bacteroidales bacterium]
MSSNPKLHNFFHQTPIQIRFNDIDQLSHVTNSVYQQYFDLGRLKYFTEVLNEKMNWEIEGLVLASITIDYLIPIRMWDSIEVLSKIYEIGNKSLKMRQEIFNNTTGEVAAVSKAVMVCFSNASGKSIPIPHRWRDLILSFEKDLQL